MKRNKNFQSKQRILEVYWEIGKKGIIFRNLNFQVSVILFKEIIILSLLLSLLLSLKENMKFAL